MSDCVTLWTIAHPGSSVREILQAGLMWQVAMPFSRGSSLPRDGTRIGRQVLYHWEVLLIVGIKP